MHNNGALIEQCTAVLRANDRGNYTQPASDLYPHQWLWDSCFTAIGWRHLDQPRAQAELTSLLRGQWQNGMLPNIIFRSEAAYRTDRNLWHSWLSPYAPTAVATSGITQPPMLAEAVVQVGRSLKKPERRLWYRQMFPALVRHHQWLYNDRDPHQEGLVLQIHPWESGLDNTPPWMQQLHSHRLSWWVRGAETLHLEQAINLFRRDTKSVPSDQRFAAIEALALFDAQLRLRRKNYAIDRILDRGLFAIEDVTFNSIFIRANQHLQAIAEDVQEVLPPELVSRMTLTERAFEELWDPNTSQYYSRDFVTHELLEVPSIGALLPLYSGSISKEHAHKLVHHLENSRAFGAPFPVPSVPLDSPDFQAERYWQGPSWVNTNWLIIDGLERYGYHDHAAALKDSTIEMVANHGCYEYFNPLDGSAAGAPGFSWTASLTLDLLHT